MKSLKRRGGLAPQLAMILLIANVLVLPTVSIAVYNETAYEVGSLAGGESLDFPTSDEELEEHLGENQLDNIQAQEDYDYYIAWSFITYAEPTFTAETKGTYSPQTVKLLEKNESGWALIDTYNGTWWVYLSDNLFYVDSPIGLYDNHEGGSYVTTISPQVVKVLEKNGDWLQIETWVGNMWINTGVQNEYLNLVNKANPLDKNYVPDDLVLVGNGQYLRESAANAFLNMQSDMKEVGLFVYARSGYRSYGTQQYLFNRAVKNNGMASAERWIARAGQSEHQTGLGIDILQRGFTGSPLSNARFQNTAQFAWMMENAHKYGFILRYPQGYENITGYAYEPWHWRYIGVEPASYMKENDIATFEAYHELMGL